MNFSLRAQHIGCRRGGRLVFEGLSFEITAGQALWVKGPNGSGKSSLMRILAGFARPANGALVFKAENPSEWIHYCGHSLALKPSETLAEMLTNHAAIVCGTKIDAPTLESAAKGFNLTNLLHTELRYFSSGQRRRAALARLLTVDRPLWLMDEPTVGLDVASREQLFTVMRDHLNRDGMILVASHDPLDIETSTVDLSNLTPVHRGDTPPLEDEEGWD